MLQIFALVSLLLLAITLWVFAIKRAGANLHQDALRTLIRAPLRFFTKTDTGVITNLFSQDLNLIDTELPDATLNTLFCVSVLSLHTIRFLLQLPQNTCRYPYLTQTRRSFKRSGKQLSCLHRLRTWQ